MNIYVASSWRNPHQPEVVRVIRSLGVEVYDFRNPDPSNPNNRGFSWRQVNPNYRTPRADGRPAGTVDANEWLAMVNHPIAVEGFNLDYQAMRRADVCVLVLPAGRSASWELGWCMGKGKQGIVFAPEPTEPELMFRQAAIVGSIVELATHVEALAAAHTRPVFVDGKPICGRTAPAIAVPFCAKEHGHKPPHFINASFAFDDDGNPFIPEDDQ